jgi:hypothetical protein
MTRRPEQLIEPFAAPPAPIIELLNSYDELDLEKLDGADLAVFLEWPGIALGDTFLVHWRGADAQGRAFDIEGIEEDVNVSNFDPQTNRVLIQITNDFIVAADQGYAFVSYELTKPALGPSLRRFMFVGVRVDRMEHMPVAQAVESHDLCIDPSALGTNGVTFVIPPYQAMHAGDDVKLTFQGFSEDLGAEPPWTDREPVLVDADIGLPVIRRVPSDQFYFLQDGDYAEVHYEVTLAAGGKSLAAPLQRFRIGKLPNDRLPQLAIDNYDGGELNPIDFPYGLTLRVAAYPQLNVSDWVLLHVNGQPAAGSRVPT